MTDGDTDTAVPAGAPTIEVLQPGPLTTIQDLGRPGLADLGIPRSGAADRRSLTLGNRLVGNPESDACLETTVVGPRLRFHSPVTFALTGAPTEALLDQRPLAMNTPVHASAGMVLTVGTARLGLHTYVAFRGGIDCDPVFGSRSTDARSGLGPPQVRAGGQLVLGAPSSTLPGVDLAPTAQPENRLRVVLGPRDDRFTATAVERLLGEPFTVTDQVSRVGARLTGPRLERRDGAELLSEPVASGALQVPADGQPILLLADHPTTGGYPVIAVVHSADLDIAGQLRPGQQIHFALAR